MWDKQNIRSQRYFCICTFFSYKSSIFGMFHVYQSVGYHTHTHTHTHTHIYIYIYIYMCVCVCVCVLNCFLHLSASSIILSYILWIWQIVGDGRYSLKVQLSLLLSSGFLLISLVLYFAGSQLFGLLFRRYFFRCFSIVSKAEIMIVTTVISSFQCFDLFDKIWVFIKVFAFLALSESYILKKKCLHIGRLSSLYLVKIDLIIWPELNLKLLENLMGLIIQKWLCLG